MISVKQLSVSHDLTSDVFLHFLLIFSKSGERIYTPFIYIRLFIYGPIIAFLILRNIQKKAKIFLFGFGKTGDTLV